MLAARTQAQNLTTTFVGVSPGSQGAGTFDDGNHTLNVQAGVMIYSNFVGFCVDPYQTISASETLVYQVQNISSLTNSSKVSLLVGQYLASPKDAANAAAAQWAIWEVVAESITPTHSLLDGNVRITGPSDQATANLADQYLTSINDFAPVALTYLTNNDRQDMVTWNVIPEPSGIALFAFSGLLLLRRRR